MRFLICIGLIVFLGCTGSLEPEDSQDQEMIQQSAVADDFYWGERIDGPANIRDKPNGKVLFELEDDAEVQVADITEGESWYRMSVWVNTPNYKGGLISEGSELYNIDGEKVGTVKSDIHPLLDNKDALYIEGYTYKGNIKQESILERAFEIHILKYGRGENQMREFIKKFGLDDTAHHQKFSGPFIYENFITDPSPGYRLMLLFELDTLQGFYHSRKVELNNITTYNLWRWNDRVSFFNDYPKEKQLNFVEYMEEWLQGVD